MLDGQSGIMVGIVNNKPVRIPFAKATKSHQRIDAGMLEIARVMAL